MHGVVGREMHKEKHFDSIGCVYKPLRLFFTPQMWAKHFFVLTDEKLFFTEQQDKEEEPEKEDEPEVGVVKVSHDGHMTIHTVVMYCCHRYHRQKCIIKRSGFMGSSIMDGWTLRDYWPTIEQRMEHF